MSWKYIGTTVQGREHIRSGKPGQDKVSYTMLNGVCVAALADGAGSALFSHFGAERVTTEICYYVVEHFDKIISDGSIEKQKENIISHVLSSLKTLAEERNCQLHDLASTLLFVGVKDKHFLLGHLGDGVIGFIHKKKGACVASTPQNGEFANETCFTTSKTASQNLRLMKGSVDEVDAFVLMSDGTSAGLYNRRKNVLAPVLARVAHLCMILELQYMQQRLNDTLNYISRKATLDDCSLVLMSKVLSIRSDFINSAEMMAELSYILTRELKQEISRRRLHGYMGILSCLQERRSIRHIAKVMHLKLGETYRKVCLLEKAKLVRQPVRGLYITTLDPSFFAVTSA